MPEDRNPYKALTILDHSAGSLLAHIPWNLRYIPDVKIAANDRLFWNRIFETRITLVMQFN